MAQVLTFVQDHAEPGKLEQDALSLGRLLVGQGGVRRDDNISCFVCAAIMVAVNGVMPLAQQIVTNVPAE
jgi:hypothetical protein